MIFGRRKFESPKMIERRRKRRKVKLYSTLVLAVVLLGVLAYLSRLNGITISNIVIKGNSSTSSDSIEKIVKNQLAGNYLFILPKENSIIYPRSDIREEILVQIKRISEVSLEVESLTTLNVEVFERSPDAAWCKTASGKEKCFFMDSSGFIYSEAPEFSGSVFLKYYGNLSGDPVGKRFLPEEEFGKLADFLGLVKKINLDIASVSIDQFGDIEASIKGDGKLIFNKDQDFSKLVDDLNSILSDESFQTELESGSNLDYIDLRFGNKVYFQFK